MDLPAHFTEAKTETSESRDFRTRTANGEPRAHPERGLGVGGARRPEPQGLGIGGARRREPQGLGVGGRGVPPTALRDREEAASVNLPCEMG